MQRKLNLLITILYEFLLKVPYKRIWALLKTPIISARTNQGFLFGNPIQVSTCVILCLQ